MVKGGLTVELCGLLTVGLAEVKSAITPLLLWNGSVQDAPGR